MCFHFCVLRVLGVNVVTTVAIAPEHGKDTERGELIRILFSVYFSGFRG